MSRISLTLSSAGLKYIVPNVNNKENELQFIFGEHEVRMSKINADFISPLISHLHRADPTIKSYTYPIDDSMNEIFSEENIQLFYKLSHGDCIEIDQSECIKLQQLSILLWNEELFSITNKIYPEQWNLDEITDFFMKCTYLRKFGNDCMIGDMKQIDIISSNFYKVDKNKLKLIPREILLSIIKNDHLKLNDEDSLLEFIIELLNEKVSSSSSESDSVKDVEFYEEIHFSCLSKDKLREFVYGFDINKITHRLWSKLRDLLFIENWEQGQNLSSNSSRYVNLWQYKTIEYNGNESGAFKGIIANLTGECKGNVHEKNEVIVTSLSAEIGEVKNVVDLENCNNYFQTKNEPNSWVKYDFKNRKVRPTHYSIRTRYDNGKGWNHPQHWVIEGSNTDRDDDWKKLDSRNNITTLDDANRIQTFNIQEELSKNEFYRFLRIRSTGPSTGDNSLYFTMSALEYFGAITLP